MDPFSYLTCGLGVYVAIAVFLVGMAWRAWQWSHTPKSPVRLGMFPKPKTGAGRFGKLLTDTFVAPQAAKTEPAMWAFAMLFHVAALGAFVGHLRLVHLFDPIEAVIGVEGMNAFAGIAGGIAGIAMLVGVVYWLSRRTFGPYKALSVPEDYFLLVLILLVVLMGDHIRFVGTLHADAFRAWFDSLWHFAPSFPAALASSGEKWALDWHMLFADLLLIYFPFSKLTHAIGAFATNLVRSSE